MYFFTTNTEWLSSIFFTVKTNSSVKKIVRLLGWEIESLRGRAFVRLNQIDIKEKREQG